MTIIENNPRPRKLVMSLTKRELLEILDQLFSDCEQAIYAEDDPSGCRTQYTLDSEKIRENLQKMLDETKENTETFRDYHNSRGNAPNLPFMNVITPEGESHFLNIGYITKYAYHSAVVAGIQQEWVTLYYTVNGKQVLIHAVQPHHTVIHERMKQYREMVMDWTLRKRDHTIPPPEIS